MAPTAHSIDSILATAVEIASEADRRAYVEQACAGDLDLTRRVEELIDNHFRAGSFLESPAIDPLATADPPAGEQPGTTIGPYRLLEPIGEGGFGTVFLAEQTQPVRRKVALKVLKPGMDMKQVVARFEAERQALALMDHPNIAKVFDGGVTSSGRPFLVMELVRGVPITEYCDQARLTPPERLRLFVQVCQAVQHAHTKGIIHRDLKPRNILVALYDGKPVPKIIDFGVAKATGAQLTEETLHTNFGAVVGTVEYMSPEQATFNQLDIDTRSDVYSLGVLLYELLTGTTPLDRRHLKDTPLLELMRIVREDDTVRPSSRLSTVEELPAIAAHRRVEPKKLSGLVRGELDWIVMKALEKDRSRRYETADALAKDVERYLADEPVLACPPSAGYRLRKFVRRNRGPVIAAALVVLVLMAGFAGTAVGLVRANQALDEKKEALGREQQIAYFHRIGLAHRELEANMVGRADEFLEECPDDLRGWEWYYLKRLRQGSLAAFEGHAEPLTDVALSPDGRLAATASADKTVKVWDTATGRCLRTLKGHMGAVGCVTFSPDGRFLASGSGVEMPVLVPAWPVLLPHSAEIRVWDPAAGEELFCLRDQADGVNKVAFSPDGQWLASAGGDGTVKIWDFHARRKIRTLSGHTKLVMGVAFSPDGLRLASASIDKTVRIWDVQSGSEVASHLGHTEWITDVAFSPDGRRVASSSIDNTVRVWDLSKSEPKVLRHLAPVFGVVFSPDGQRLASAGWDKTVKIWDVATGQEVLTLRGHSGTVRSVAFSGDGRRIASASEDRTMRIWDATPVGERLPLEVFSLHHAHHILTVAYAPNGRYLAAGGLDQKVTLWDPTNGRQVHTFSGHTGLVEGVAFSPDRRHLASASWDETVKVWDIETGQEVYSLPHRAAAVSVAYSPDGRYLASGNTDGAVLVWEVATRREVCTFDRDKGAMNALAFSPDCKHLASGADGVVRVWDMETRREVLLLRGHSDYVGSVAYSPDGLKLATTSWDGTAKLWEAKTGRLTRTLSGDKERLNKVSFSADGRRLATASVNGTVKVWDTKTGLEIRTLTGHSGMVWCVAFSPDGKQLAAASGHYGKGEVRIWDAAAPEMNPGLPAGNE